MSLGLSIDQLAGDLPTVPERPLERVGERRAPDVVIHAHMNDREISDALKEGRIAEARANMQRVIDMLDADQE